MSDILLGTDAGILRLASRGSELRTEEGPPAAFWFAKDSERVFAMTQEGALWSETGAGSWSLVNSKCVAEDVWSFGADPKVKGRLYAGTAYAFLYISDDGGSSWKCCESIKSIPGYETWTFPPPPHIPHVRSISADPKVAGAVYIGVEEGGIFRSEDDGDTWQGLNEGLDWDVHTVRPLPGTSTIYATTGVGFHRSDDNGAHWRHIMQGLDRRYTHPIVFAPQSGNLLFTASANTPPPGWRPSANCAIYRSEDSGESWAKLEKGLPDPFDVMVRQLVVDEEGDVYTAAGTQLLASRDAGDSWDVVKENLPHVRALAVV